MTFFNKHDPASGRRARSRSDVDDQMAASWSVTPPTFIAAGVRA